MKIKKLNWLIGKLEGDYNKLALKNKTMSKELKLSRTILVHRFVTIEESRELIKREGYDVELSSFENIDFYRILNGLSEDSSLYDILEYLSSDKTETKPYSIGKQGTFYANYPRLRRGCEIATSPMGKCQPKEISYEEAKTLIENHTCYAINEFFLG